MQIPSKEVLAIAGRLEFKFNADDTYFVECLDGCGDYSHHGQPLDWAGKEAGRHMHDFDGHRANVKVEWVEHVD